MKASAAAWVCVLCWTLPLEAGDRVAIRVFPAIAAFAPATVVVWAIVEPHPDNRRVEVTVESVDMYRSSQIDIEGANARRTNAFEFRNLPAGVYQATVVLVDAKERRFETRQEFRVAS